MATWLDGIVVENYRWNERLTSLKFEAPLGPFKAGQFVRVGMEIDGEIVARPYSLVNNPGESPLEIYFNIVPEGPLTPPLFELQAGDPVLVAPKPAGFLIVDEIPVVEQLWMMATGTAIGPFLSILKGDAVWKRFKQVVLCYSVRNAGELAYAKRIAELVKAHPDQLHFVPFITREDVPGALRMRIPASIVEGVLEARTGLELTPANSHVMMCGSTEMIAEVGAVLEARGLRRHRRREPGHYTTEKYH